VGGGFASVTALFIAAFWSIVSAGLVVNS